MDSLLFLDWKERIEDVAVVIDAVHLCVSARRVKDSNSSTITATYTGKFENDPVKNEFLKLIQ